MISIHYSNGRVLQGIVLAFGDRLMRVAVKGSEDTIEFRLVSQVWVSEECEVVKLEFAECETRPVCELADPRESLIHFQSQAASLQRLM